MRGRIESADVRQQTDPEGNLKTWNDGSPVMQLVVTLATDLNDDANDDGRRAIYAKGGNYEAASGEGTSMLVAIREAVKKAGGSKLEPGATLTVRHTGLGKKTSAAYSAPKLYRAKYEPAAVDLEDPF